MLRVRYKNVNRDLTGEIGEDQTNGKQGESQTFLSTTLHVFNVVHLGIFFFRLLRAAVLRFSCQSISSFFWLTGPFYLTPSHTPR